MNARFLSLRHWVLSALLACLTIGGERGGLAQDEAPVTPDPARETLSDPAPAPPARPAADRDAESAESPALPSPDSPGTGNPASPPVAVEPGDDTAPDIERQVYVPFEDLEAIFEDEGRGVFLPYREFLALWNQLQLPDKTTAEKPPMDGVLASARYQASGEGEEGARVLAIEATLQVESFKDEGWAVVPLIKSGLQAADAETGDAVLHLGPEGYQLLLPRKGQYEIKLTLYAKIQGGSGRESVRLNLPKAGVSRFEAIIPEQGWTFDLQPGAAYSTEPLDDGATRLAFFFGETEQFQLSWQKQGEETKLTPLLFVESDLSTRIVPGALQSDVRFDYRVLRAGVDRFEITVPEDQEVLGVAGENIREWDVQREGGEQTLTVQLHAPAKLRYSLVVTLERSLESLPAEFDAPNLIAEGVVRQRGSVTLLNHAELEVTEVDSEGLSQQSSEGEAVPDGLMRFGRFRYLSAPFSLRLGVKAAEPVVQVESFTRFTVEPDLATFLARFDYAVQRVGIFETQIVIPDDFEGVEARGPLVEDFSEETVEGERILTVKFSRRVQGNASFEVSGRRLRPDEEEAAVVPVFEPLEVERHEGKIGLQIHPSLDPVTEDPGDLRQQDVSLLRTAAAGGNAGQVLLGSAGNGGGLEVNVASQISVQGQQQAAMPTPAGIPGSGPLTIGFRYRGEAQPATIAFTLKEPQINGEVLLLVDVREQLARYEWRVRYEVLYAGVDRFVVSIPEAISENLRVDGDLIKEKDRDYTPEADDPDAPEVEEGRKLWSVVLRDRKMGAYELRFSLEQPLEHGEEREFSLGVPELRLEQVFQETGQVAVVKDDNLEVLEATVENLELIDPKELKGSLAREGVIRAYKYRRHPVALNLSMSRNQFLAVPRAVVTYAWLSTVVSSDGGMTTEAIYWIKNNATQFLSVELPDGGSMVSDVFVSGEAQQPMRRADQSEVLIRLPLGAESREAFPVRFVYEIPSDAPGEPLGLSGRLEVQPAVVTDAEVLQALVQLYLPSEYVYRDFDGPMQLPPGRRGWTRFRGAFDWLVPALGPQLPEGPSQAWTAPPSPSGESGGGFDVRIPKEGQRFDLQRLDAPSSVLIAFRSRTFAFVLESLAMLLAFAVGAVLLSRPARVGFLYFVAVGLGSLVIAGAVAPGEAPLWRAVYLGVFLAALVWIAAWVIAGLKRLGSGRRASPSKSTQAEVAPSYHEDQAGAEVKEEKPSDKEKEATAEDGASRDESSGQDEQKAEEKDEDEDKDDKRSGDDSKA